MDQVIKELRGHSGSTVLLMKNTERYFIRKINNVQRNYERLSALSTDYPVPKIYQYNYNALDMQYIHGLDMKTYLLHNTIDALSEFLIRILNKLRSIIVTKDYSTVYQSKLSDFDSHSFSFTTAELLSKLPKLLPSSVYHGDLTLDNIICSNSQFYLIDPVTIEYDSYVFDIAKLRQDLQCKWFLRNSDYNLDVKLQNLQCSILSHFPEANIDALLITQLYRVLKHCHVGDDDYVYLWNKIEETWKAIQ